MKTPKKEIIEAKENSSIESVVNTQEFQEKTPEVKEVFENAILTDEKIKSIIEAETPEAVKVDIENQDEIVNKADLTIKTADSGEEETGDKLLNITAKTISGTISAIFVFLCLLLDGRENSNVDEYELTKAEKNEEAELFKQLFKSKGIAPPIEFTLIAHILGTRIRFIYKAWIKRKEAAKIKTEITELSKQNEQMKIYINNLKNSRIIEKENNGQPDNESGNTEKNTVSLVNSGN